MKFKMYTNSHDSKILKKMGNFENIFSSNELSNIIEEEFSKTVFESKDSLIEDYIVKEYLKLYSIPFLVEYIIKNKCKNILSLGSGSSVLEYILKKSIPKEYSVTCCDFNNFLLEKTNLFFPEINSHKFDFFNDSFTDLCSSIKVKPDIVIFFGSSYVMDNDLFIKLLNEIKSNGINNIIDFQAGYMDNKLAIIKLTKKIFNGFLGNKKNIGKFHGFIRDRKELIKIYQKSKFKLKKITSNPAYKFIAVLN